MAGGLVALLDDVAAIAKIAAASVDDISAAAGKATAKAAGVVIDDTAVTPRYVTGFTADRELPIIWRIALGSIRNKLLFLLPAALLLSAFLPWAITPLLMLGGSYLCFEGAEKVIELLTGHGHDVEEEHLASATPLALEQQKISGAIRTDFILSAEIMAIALAEITLPSIWLQGAALAGVAFAVTGGVYGIVALIVKMDDIGLHLAARDGALAGFGKGLVHAMPHVMTLLSGIGTAAMIWVGGGIVLHGLNEFGLGALPHAIEDFAHGLNAGGVIEWIVNAAAAGVFGLLIGGVIAMTVHRINALRGAA